MDQHSLEKLILNNPNIFHGNGISEKSILISEKKLGSILPISYKSYLCDFGWLSFDSFEIYGLGEKIPPHLDLVKQNLKIHNLYNGILPKELIIFYEYGNGDYNCFNTLKNILGESPIVTWNHEAMKIDEYGSKPIFFINWLTKKLKFE